MFKSLKALIALALKPQVRGIIGAMSVKAASVISAFVIFTFAARVLGEEDFGKFAVLFSAGSMAAVFVAFGQEMLIIRIWTEGKSHNQPGFVKGGLYFGLVASAVGSTLGGLAFLTYFSVMEDVSLALSMSGFVATTVILLFTSSLARTTVSVLAGDGQRELTGFLVANVVLIWCFAQNYDLPLFWVINLLTIGKLLAVGIQSMLILRVINRHHKDVLDAAPKYDPKTWIPRSVHLWIASAVETTSQFFDVILIGFLLDPIAAGAYFVASRLANGFASAADGFNMFAMRQFPDLYFKKDEAGMESLLQTLSIITLLTVLAGLAVVVVAGNWLLLLFGTEYMAYTGILLLLCIGTAAMAASGPAAPVLMLTGGEAVYLKIVSLSLVVRYAGFFLLIPIAGITGAALAAMGSLVFMAVLIGVKSKSTTGHNVTVTRVISLISGMHRKARQS